MIATRTIAIPDRAIGASTSEKPRLAPGLFVAAIHRVLPQNSCENRTPMVRGWVTTV